jgi:hypothetical protein
MYVSDSQYTGNVVWKVTSGGQTLGGLFEAGTAYTATVTLTAVSGWTFSGVGADGFNHTGKSGISNGANSGVVTITFPATTSIPVAPIDSVALTNVLPAPITGASPLMSFNTGTYSGTAAWTTGGGTPVTLFEVGTVYTATVTLYPVSGYSFPASLPVTHGGGSGSIANFTGEPRRGTITFPPTGILSFYNGPFSGVSSAPLNMDSAVDMIRMAKEAGHNSLYLQLTPRPEETISNTTAGNDVSGGLELNTGNSPAIVVIDGGGRSLQMAEAGTLITVTDGVTLTLRNITMIGHSGNTDILVMEAGGRVIYETGASIIDNGLIGGPLSGFKAKQGDSAIDQIRAADPSVPLVHELSPGIEVVNLNNTADIGTGLVLNNTNSPAEVTIDGKRRTIQLGSTNGALLTVGAGVTLTLKNITLTGKSGNSSQLVSVSGGTLILDSGAVITGNARSGNVNGGGIVVSAGELVMNAGAAVTNNSTPWGSGGVEVGGGTFTMNGGVISGNSAKYSGAIHIHGGAFIMNGGEITGNLRYPISGADCAGIRMNGGTFTMWGGLIQELVRDGGTAQWNQNKGGVLVALTAGKYGTLDLR